MADRPLLFAVDENLDQRIVDGLRRRNSKLDIVGVTEAGLSAASDPDVLAWAAREGRLLVTHDRKTMPDFAFERIAQGHTTPGVLIVPLTMGIGQAIEDLLLIAEASTAADWADRVTYLPL
jgi:predicted nuclease of predicted toxin-antitoxin system